MEWNQPYNISSESIYLQGNVQCASYNITEDIPDGPYKLIEN